MSEKVDVVVQGKALLGDIRQLIDDAKQRAAAAVNAEIVNTLCAQLGCSHV